VPEQVERYEKVVEDTYAGIDEQVGEALAAIGSGDTLIVMSDHGFTSFRRGFNLNTWLCRHGYIKLLDPNRQSQDLLFANVDWSGTKLYGLGLNGLYVNLKGRERHGTVNAAVQRSLLAEIRDKLMEVRDTDGSPVIASANLVDDMYPGADRAVAPDLIVGYADSYNASWATVLGEMPPQILEDNMDRWSGNHLTDPQVVPGVLVSNRKILAENPSISDMAPTILSEFGLPRPGSMTGRGLFDRS
jgi:predicted AlkP superfamily phosphohydrolase/phosphomutase